MITQARLHRILDYDPVTGVFKWKMFRAPNAQKGWRAGFIRPDGYRQIALEGELYLGHRLAWFYMHGVWPIGIDHKDRDKNNNAITNLRVANQHQNLGNKTKHKNNTSGYKGVSWFKRDSKWKAAIHIHGKNIHLGYFNTPQQAHAAYVAAAKQYFGAYARFA